MTSNRAYTSGQPSRYQAERMRAENERRRAVANRCTGRRKSTATNPLPHVYGDVGGDCMGCKHCPAVRTLTSAEYRAKYGVDRPPPRPQQAGGGAVGDFCRALLGLVILVVIVGGIGASLYYGHAYCVAHGTCQ